MRSENCGNCANWDKDGKGPEGRTFAAWRRCRGSTPCPEVNPQFGFTRGSFVFMPPGEWCASHKPVVKPPEAVGVRVTSTVE